MRDRWLRCLAVISIALAFQPPARATEAAPNSATASSAADVVVTGARIYTANSQHTFAQALAIRGGRIVFVGSSTEAHRWIGPRTEVKDLHGQLVLPGLFDSHIHPAGIVVVDSCDLDSARKTLRELTAFVRGCVEHFKVPAGGWLSVHQWNFSDGNEPDADYPTLVAALDEASGQVAIQLLGNDGHHGAFNHVALARARNAKGAVVGLSKATLTKDFAAYTKFVGVDAEGNPNGAVNEDGRALMESPNILMGEFEQIMKARAQLPQRLNAAGITGILDALVPPDELPLYDALDKEGLLTVRATLAQFYDPETMKTSDGRVDYDRMLSSAKRIRAKYASNPLIRSDVVKLFADGVLEGNPYAVPPTLPNPLSLRPYNQPIFGKDASGHLAVTGYVDTGSALCRQVREQPAQFSTAEAVKSFMSAHGYHPGQCAVSTGQLQHDRAVTMEFVKRFHLAGFTLHIHAISDGSVRTALDAVESARAADGVSTQHDGFAHVQVAHPSDVARIGRDHLYVAFTYSWAQAEPDYDLTVVPFFDHVIGNSYSVLHPPGGYYETNAYPVKSVKAAGATLVAGSDAPVNTRDPQPFVNMAIAVTRRLPGQQPLNASQAISIQEVLDAYTINGARFLSRDTETGSLETGKSADFIVVNQDVLKLAAENRAGDIAKTHVVETWFMGKKVYVAAAHGGA
ncbi:MAG: amidohydrolase family protein [Proteobacteria bacterium]|nr:amidohydrolase family protein [Pseudomonadota bacterium]